MDQWLVRTAGNRIEGPFTREQVIGLIRDRKLGLQDEICQANQYWIFLHEHHEIQRQLGIQIPRTKGVHSGFEGDDETTETQTEVPLNSPAPEAPKDLHEGYDGHTAVIMRDKPARSPSPHPSRNFVPKSAQAISVAGTSVPRPKIERSSVWRALAWIMVAVAVLIIFAVLKLLRTGV